MPAGQLQEVAVHGKESSGRNESDHHEGGHTHLQQHYLLLKTGEMRLLKFPKPPAQVNATRSCKSNSSSSMCLTCLHPPMNFSLTRSDLHPGGHMAMWPVINTSISTCSSASQPYASSWGEMSWQIGVVHRICDCTAHVLRCCCSRPGQVLGSWCVHCHQSTAE